MSTRWHLSGFAKGGELIHDETCGGDEALNTALRALEARPDFKRSSVVPETRANRPTFIAPTAPPPVAEVIGAPCVECGMSKTECLRRAATNGHDFTPRTEGDR